CRVIVTRGVGRIGFSKKAVHSPPGYVVIAQAVEPPTPDQLKRGLTLRVVDRIRNDRRAQDPAAKTGNYLNSLLAYLEAEAAGDDDALLCNADQHVTEGTTFNIGYVKRGIIVTPPLDIGVLVGITRKYLLAGCRRRGLEVREVRFPKERLYEADEVFATGTVKEVFPVSSVDGKKIPMGPMVLRLQSIYREVLRESGGIK
ncbi:MAG: aminotransferase class IV, partial [Bdellovibrionota bacterium]